MKLKDVEKDPKKRDTIRKNLNEFITAAERVSKKAKSPRSPVAGESAFTGETQTGEIGEARLEIIRPGSKSTEKQVSAEGERQKGQVNKDAEIGEGMLYDDDPIIEWEARKNSKSKFALLIFSVLALATIIILIVVLTASSNSSTTTNEESYTMTTGWRLEFQVEISGFEEGLSLSQVEDQLSSSLEVVEAELDLHNEEFVSLDVLEEVSAGSYTVLYFVLSPIEGNADTYKTYIQDNTNSLEEKILESTFGSSTPVDHTITIDDTDDGLVIVLITASPTLQPTLAPSAASVPTNSEPTTVPTPFPTNFPTKSPTVVGPISRTINWVVSLCCLLESHIDSTVSSVAAVLSVTPDRIDVETYDTARRRNDFETATTWNIVYQIYIYTTDDPNLHTEITNSLEDDGVLDAIADHITNNLNATISSIETLSISVDDDSGNGITEILMMVLYALAGVVALVIVCYCACKCVCKK